MTAAACSLTGNVLREVPEGNLRENPWNAAVVVVVLIDELHQTGRCVTAKTSYLDLQKRCISHENVLCKKTLYLDPYLWVYTQAIFSEIQHFDSFKLARYISAFLGDTTFSH